jgi:hypothetical protein
MNPDYWRESFTRRHFLENQETLPGDAVGQVWQQVLDIHKDAARWIQRLHSKRWHGTCSYPLLQVPESCEACRTILDLEHFLLHEIYVHIDGVVIDFFHEPAHKDQLEAAIKLYAWSVFQQCKHGKLVHEENELFAYAMHRVGRLFSESFVHKPVREQGQGAVPGEQNPTVLTSEEDLERLAHIFADTYATQVRKFYVWRMMRPGVPISAFSAE